jgi:hypothetical protein
MKYPEVQGYCEGGVEPVVGFFFLGKIKGWPSAQSVLFSLDFPFFFFVFFAMPI